MRTLILAIGIAALALNALAVNPNIRQHVRDMVPGAQNEAAAPVQPAKGPGGRDYRHGAVAETTFGEGADQCWVFEPDKPKPAKAPVVVFLHGWGGMTPAPYRAWITHLARRGNIVIYPRYQILRTRGPEFTPNAIKAVKAALTMLKTEGHVKPDTARFAIAGHSAGAVGAVNMAALAAREGLPPPRALMIVQPGRGPNADSPNPIVGIPLEDLATIDPKALALVLVGNEDRIAGDAVAKDIFHKLKQIPARNKDYVTVRSDGHGLPQLKADHFSPCAGDKMAVDALDWYAYWKLLDGLTDAAFLGRNRHYCLGGAKPMTSMGTWSDGRQVWPLLVTDKP